jgi:hypothetical protein
LKVVLAAGMMSFTLAPVSGQPAPKPLNPWCQEAQVIVKPQLPESAMPEHEGAR